MYLLIFRALWKIALMAEWTEEKCRLCSSPLFQRYLLINFTYLSYNLYYLHAQGEAGDQFLEQLFRIFDKDGDGSIDFKEFMIATDMTSSGDPEEKLRWAFRMYDKDGSGEDT